MNRSGHWLTIYSLATRNVRVRVSKSFVFLPATFEWISGQTKYASSKLSWPMLQKSEVLLLNGMPAGNVCMRGQLC